MTFLFTHPFKARLLLQNNLLESCIGSRGKHGFKLTQMSLSMKQKQTHRQSNRYVAAEGEDRWGRDGVGVWDQQVQTITHRMGGQGPTVQRREPYSIS